MEGFAKEKDGKVVQVAVVYDDHINSIKITGDFFMHPEEGVKELESCMIGHSLSESDSELLSCINKAVSEHNIELVGIKPETIVRLVRKATE